MLFAQATPVTASSAQDAYGIFLRARSAVSAAQYPGRMDYTIAISGLAGKTAVTNHYRASTLADGTIRVAPISLEEAASPPIPHGINVSISAGLYGAAIVIPLGPPPPSADLIGVPLIAPTYMFGLRYPQTMLAAPPTADASGLRTIAVVSTATKDYSVTLVDTPVVDQTPCYHLRLVPLRKPHDNRLRELWVGMSDYLPRQAFIAGNFTTAPLVDVPWSIDFAVVDSVPLVVREAAAATLYLPHRRVVREATVAFENIRTDETSIFNRPLITPETTGTTLVEP